MLGTIHYFSIKTLLFKISRLSKSVVNTCAKMSRFQCTLDLLKHKICKLLFTQHKGPLKFSLVW